MHVDAPETSELEAFLAIVDHGSFAKAAEALALPRATVSRRLKRLEQRLGVRLFRRTTRKVALTQSGRHLDPHARSIVAAIRAAADAVQQVEGPPRGLVRVSTPPGAPGRLEELMVGFAMAHPLIRLEVERSTRQVDLVAGGFDVALRATSQLDPGLIARRIASTHLRAWASRDYLAEHGHPASVDDLAGHACFVGYTRGERPATGWPLLDGGTVPIRPRLASNDLLFLASAAERGLGIALLPDLLASGRPLVPVLTDVVGTASTLAFVYADRQLSPPVRAFVDHMLAHADELFPSSDEPAIPSTQEG